MKINEIFYSIQGEGKWTGLANIFIRTSGCNLRCNFCDTKYAYHIGKELSIENIIKSISKYPCKKICITGGEPLLQDDIYQFINRLLKIDFKICLETNGSICIKELSKIKPLIISMDIKCPSSNMNEKNFFENISFLEEKDQLKFVIKDMNDYNYSKKILSIYKPVCNIYFQPVWGTNPKNLSEWIISDGLNVRLGLQIHKFIWIDKKGY